MRVLLVGNYLPDRQDSMQLYAAHLRDGLRARGHEVKLLHPPAILGGRPATPSALAKWLGYVDKFLLFRRRLRRAAEQADIVHLCDHSNAMYIPALAGMPLVVTCHDVLAMRSAMGHFPENRVGLTGRIFQHLIAHGLCRAPSILCVSQKTRDDLHDYLHVPAARLHVVPNALHWLYVPMPPAQRTPLLSAFGLAPDARYFLHVGGNHWYKNRGAVLAIFAALRRRAQYSEALLVMAGGHMTAELTALGRAQGLGDVVLEVSGASHEQLQALYSGALAMLFPSLEEGFGWPILESQACGCPVVIANRPPMTDVAGGAAILIDPAQPVTAAVTIAHALQDPAGLRDAGLHNASEYTPERMLNGCEALYREAMSAVQR